MTEKYLFISDLQIPDHNEKAVEAVLSFIPDFQPDQVMIVGDFLNCTSVSSFTSPDYFIDLASELDSAREILQKLIKQASGAKFTWFDGNHEQRICKYLASSANVLQRLTVDGEKVVSLPHLLKFKELGIRYVPYMDAIEEHGVLITHGEIARKYSGYTENGMLDAYGQSGISGHTHRPALVTKTVGKRQMFWMNIGCLCNLTPTPRYMGQTNWQNAFGIAHVVDGVFYPQLIPIINNSFVYGGVTYAAREISTIYTTSSPRATILPHRPSKRSSLHGSTTGRYGGNETLIQL